MKTWIITEAEIRDIIANCGEILKEDPDNRDLGNPKRCLIREHYLQNPIFLAIYMSVVDLRDHKFISTLMQVLKSILGEIPNKPVGKAKQMQKAVMRRAIEVEQ